MTPTAFAAFLSLALLASDPALGSGVTGAETKSSSTENRPVTAMATKKSGPRKTAVSQETNQLFGLTNLWTFHLKIEPEAWKAMEPSPPAGPRRGGPPGFPNDYKFVHAALEFDGQAVG